MAETLPLNIPIPQSAAIASFNYSDIAEGTGILKLNGAVSYVNGTQYYYLTTNSPYSQEIVTSGSTTTGELKRMFNNGFLDFDITFNRPQNIKGTAYLNIPIGATVGTARDAATGIWISGALLQISGASAVTNVTTAVSGAVLSFPTVAQYDKVMLIPMVIPSTTHIKAGETLRLHLELWAQAGGAGTLNYVGLGHDPAGRDDPAANVTTNVTLSGADTPTKLSLYVPFLLNIT